MPQLEKKKKRKRKRKKMEQADQDVWSVTHVTHAYDRLKNS